MMVSNQGIPIQKSSLRSFNPKSKNKMKLKVLPNNEEQLLVPLSKEPYVKLSLHRGQAFYHPLVGQQLFVMVTVSSLQIFIVLCCLFIVKTRTIKQSPHCNLLPGRSSVGIWMVFKENRKNSIVEYFKYLINDCNNHE